MALANSDALRRKTEIFIKKETTFGTFNMPAGSDAIRVTDVPSPGQDGGFTDFNEILNSRSRQGRNFDGFSAGNFTIPMLMRLSGVAGTKPPGADLIECALGALTTTANSVSGALAVDLPGFSAIVKEDHTTAYVSGAKVNQWSLSYQRKGPVALEFQSQCLKVVHAGTAEVAVGSSGTTINVASGEAYLFEVGAYVQTTDDDNSGAGFAVSGTSPGGDYIVLASAPSPTPSATDSVFPFVPTASYSGTVVEGNKGFVTLDGTSHVIVSAKVTVNNNNQPDEAEITGDNYLSAIDEGSREVSAEVEARFKRMNAQFFKKAKEQVRGSLVIGAGDTAGLRAKFTFPYCEFNTPGLGGDDIKRNITLQGHAFPSSSNEDEAAFVIY